MMWPDTAIDNRAWEQARAELPGAPIGKIVARAQELKTAAPDPPAIATATRQCDCEMRSSQEHGHIAGGCKRKPVYKIHFSIFGVTANLCRDCFDVNTRELRLIDWQIEERYR